MGFPQGPKLMGRIFAFGKCSWEMRKRGWVEKEKKTRREKQLSKVLYQMVFHSMMRTQSPHVLSDETWRVCF